MQVVKGVAKALVCVWLHVMLLLLLSDLEKEVESLKQQSSNSSSDESALIQVCLSASVLLHLYK